jgi:hypothetical protein|tara:strand:+ start:497 stop:2593 length:2097 start_codon:yes stop_codon:yes gene_type:complete
MPKLPTFQAEGSVSQLAGTTTGTQVPLTQTLGTALKPITDLVVKQKVQEKNFENRTEALKLENDFITDMQKVNDEVNILENKDQANAIYKEKSNALISSYADKASNQNVKTLFTNSALGEVQKGLFRVDTQISKNILNSLNNNVAQKEKRLLTTAFLATGDFDYAVLQTDLEKLYKDHYTGQISNADLTKLVDGIPGRIEIFEATQGLTENTKETYLKLKDDKQFVNMPLKERMELINDATLILRPELRLDYKNFIAAAKVGKTIPFDMKFAKEVFEPKEIIGMQEQFLMVTNALEDTKTLNRIPSKDIDETLKTMIKNKYDSMNFIDAQNMENYLKTIVSTRLEAMKTNPVKFIIDTNDEAKRLLDEFTTEENLTLKTENKKAFVNYIYEEQVKMGNPNYLIKVTSTDEANQFVEQYLQSDAGTRLAMLQNAEDQFGDFFSKAMLEFTEAGLPETAELSSFFGNPQLTKKFLSFDSDEEKKQLEEFVSLKDFPMVEIKRDILKDLEDFEAAVMFANKFDTSFAADKLDRIVDVLGYYAANEIRAGVKPSKAVKNASNLINQSFEIEDSYFIPRIYDGVSLPNGQVDFIKEKSKAIQKEYIDLWGAVSFKSFDENIDVELLDKEMKEQMLKNGRWVNNSDGTGLIFGITFGDGSFAPVFNKEGETLELKFDDDSYLLPNTDIRIQIGGKSASIEDYGD